MDIYVLHDGREIGPLSTEKTWLLLNQGSIQTDDLAWTPGMSKWEPLKSFLPPAESAAPPAATEAPAFAPAPEVAQTSVLDFATPKQRALLAFLHISFNRSTSKTEAALLISDAMENPAYTVRLGQWPTERLKLHGDLFVAELQAKKENRAHHFLALRNQRARPLSSASRRATRRASSRISTLSRPTGTRTKLRPRASDSSRAGGEVPAARACRSTGTARFFREERSGCTAHGGTREIAPPRIWRWFSCRGNGARALLSSRCWPVWVGS